MSPSAPQYTHTHPPHRVSITCPVPSPHRPTQHLTTFVMDRKEAMITIEDGIRKLRLLEAKGKVWTQDMLLQVEEKTVSLIDQETKVGETERWWW